MAGNGLLRLAELSGRCSGGRGIGLRVEGRPARQAFDRVVGDAVNLKR